MKAWLLLLLFLVLAGANAGVVFNVFNRALAGYLAGGVFVALGIAAFVVSHRYSFGWRGLNLTIAGIFLFGFALPLFLARVLTPYPDPVASVFGLPLDLFHRGSTFCYSLLVAVTLIQLWQSRQQKTRG